jgi:hypothetical protein
MKAKAFVPGWMTLAWLAVTVRGLRTERCEEEEELSDDDKGKLLLVTRADRSQDEGANLPRHAHD